MVRWLSPTLQLSLEMRPDRWRVTRAQRLPALLRRYCSTRRRDRGRGCPPYVAVRGCPTAACPQRTAAHRRPMAGDGPAQRGAVRSELLVRGLSGALADQETTPHSP